MKPNWLQVKNQGDAAEILIQGPIGKDWWTGDGMAEKEFTDALATIPEGRQITIGINSEGGSVQDGLGIFNAIKRRSGDITARIDGYAVSIASVIPLAAHKVVSPKSSIWMIHEPSMGAIGNSADMLKAAELLEVHAETITDIYASEIGISKEKAREMMKAESWFRGDDAVKLGFADEVNDDAVVLNCFHPTSLPHFRHIPENILKAVGNAGHTNDSQPPVTPPASISSVGNAAAVEASENTTSKGKDRTMEGKDNTAAPAAPIVIDFKPVIDLLERIESKLNGPAGIPPGAPPIAMAPGLEIKGNRLQDRLEKFPSAQAKFEFMRNEWPHLCKTYEVLNANTDSTSSALLPNIVQSGAITFLQSRLAPLKSFARIFGQGVLNRNVLAVPHITAAGTAQSNPTDFEDTTNFVNTLAAISITPAHLVSGSHITNAQLQSGWEISLWVESKVGELADKIQAAVNAIITTGNFGAADFTGSYAGFSMDDLKTIWAVIDKARVKSIMLDSEYYAQFIPGNLEAFNPLATSTLPGWDGFYHNTYWTGATANTIGFACNPQAIGCGAGLPNTIPTAEPGIQSSIITLPEIGLDIQSFQWWSKSTRTHWATLELMFGAAKGDGEAGSLLASA